MRRNLSKILVTAALSAFVLQIFASPEPVNFPIESYFKDVADIPNPFVEENLLYEQVTPPMASIEQKVNDAEDTPFLSKTVKLANDQTVSHVFSALNIPLSMLFPSKSENKEFLDKVRPGSVVKVFLLDNEPHEVQISRTDRHTMVIRNKPQLNWEIFPPSFERTVNTFGTSISRNFYIDSTHAGATPRMIMNLAQIFQYDIDFSREIRPGDQYAMVSEILTAKDGYKKSGRILAAEFMNAGEKFNAYLFKGRYYTEEGRSIEKAFLRAPVRFDRISSEFNPRRLHPVTGRIRPHRGIDYAARTGTPVQSAGDGLIIKAGYSKYNGNYVVIQHSKKYQTKYLHLNRKHVRVGDKVSIGEKIGTVGSTGLATGPHLHYEFLVNNHHVDPKTVEVPRNTRVSKSDLEAFNAVVHEYKSSLHDNTGQLVATNTTGTITHTGE